MSQTLSDMVGARKWAAQERLLSLPGYDLTAKRTRAANGTEPGAELENHMDEERVKLKGDSKNNLLCAWRVNTIKGSSYSERKVNGGLEDFKKEDLHFKNEMSLKVL